MFILVGGNFGGCPAGPEAYHDGLIAEPLDVIRIGRTFRVQSV